ncbi:hypothetical protein FRB99_000687 [Tulasnella sp. 403]|nr:hypothetical protein FRB99_000687 [Tulasnella sp. 403]
MKEKAMIERNLKLLLAKQRFVLKLAKALMLYGAPSHRLESQLVATARVLAVPCQVIHFPGVVLLSFHDKVAKTSETHIVKATTRLMLGKLHTVHMIYRGVVHSEIGVQEGTDKLTKLIKAPPAYPTLVRCAIAFCCATIICLTSFGGSVLDALVAGWAGATLAYLQLHAVKRSVMYANIFEISTAIWVAFVARALSSWQGDYFCYSAISSAGVVLILPGFAVLCSALELASKNFISGSARLVWAVSYTLFLGFSLTAGSDLWFLLDSSARSRRRAAAASLTSIVYLNGTLTPNRNETLLFDALQQTLGTTLDGAWTFVNKTGPRNEIVSAVGAFVIGVLGNVYARVFKGTAFTSMVTGVCFLVPSGLAAAGGLAMNYQGSDEDQYTSSIIIGVRMLSVAIGTTVGLLASSLVVYAFGPKKQSALFAF